MNQTAYRWCWKGPLYQLSHNHCPNYLTLITPHSFASLFIVTCACRLTVKSSQVLHGDLAVAPDRRDDEEELLAPQAPERRPEVVVADGEAENPFVHVQNH